MRQIYTKCESLEEADELGHFIMGKGFEGVKNDSYRYCKLFMESALRENARHHWNHCYVGVDGCQLIVGKSKKEMRRQKSIKYIEKIRVFKELLTPVLLLPCVRQRF